MPLRKRRQRRPLPLCFVVIAAVLLAASINNVVSTALAAAEQQHQPCDPNKDVGAAGTLNWESFERVTSSSIPVLVKIDPSLDCKDCRALQEFWNMAAQAHGASRVWHGSCFQDPKLCHERNIVECDAPLLEGWNGRSWVIHEGPQDLQSLKDWMDEILFSSQTQEMNIRPNGQQQLNHQNNNLPPWCPPDPSLLSYFNLSLLHAAAFGGDVEAVRDILRASTNDMEKAVNKRSYHGFTPLMLAAQAGHLRVVEALLDEFHANVNIRDAQGCSALRAASLTGQTEVTRALLERGATIILQDAQAFSLSNVVRQCGHHSTADLLEQHAKEHGVADIFEQHRSHLRTTNELPPGAILSQCHHPINIEAARCRLAKCQNNSNDKMPTVNAMTIDMDADGVGRPISLKPLGDVIRTIALNQTMSPHPSWKFFQPKCHHFASHLPPDKRNCPVGHPSCSLTMPWASACQDSQDDIWPCLFGRGEATDRLRVPCDCDNATTTASTNKDVMALLNAAILLDGNRTSPHLTPGPAPAACSSDDGSIAVSIHARGGDACDITTWGANETSWAFFPFQWKRNGWQGNLRYCIHPRVHLAALRGVVATRKVSTVFLATDSVEAVEVFQNELPALGIELVLNQFDRKPLDPYHNDGKSGESGTRTRHDSTDYWIEFRAQNDPLFAAHAMHTALEDVRLLARGNLLIAGLCSNMAQVAYAAMIGHNGLEIPVVSVDRCEVLCDDPNTLAFHFGHDFVN